MLSTRRLWNSVRQPLNLRFFYDGPNGAAPRSPSARVTGGPGRSAFRTMLLLLKGPEACFRSAPPNLILAARRKETSTDRIDKNSKLEGIARWPPPPVRQSVVGPVDAAADTRKP